MEGRGSGAAALGGRAQGAAKLIFYQKKFRVKIKILRQIQRNSVSDDVFFLIHDIC